MKQVRFHPEAQQELEEHESWYRERSEIAAQGFLLELRSCSYEHRRIAGAMAARPSRRAEIRVPAVSVHFDVPRQT